MSRIRSSNTIAERTVQSYLFKRGLRFRKNSKSLPGKPDLVFPKQKVILFVHGCYWHRHKDCLRATTPKSNKVYWRNKFKMNVQRDQKNQSGLRRLGYKVLIFWECQTKMDSKLEKLFNKINSYKVL